MIDWHPQRIWIGLLIAAIVIGAGNAPLLGIAQQKAVQNRVVIHAKNIETTQALQQLQEDTAAAEKMKTEIDAHDTDRLLASADRLRAAQILERRAAELHLTHFTYTLSPEEKTSVDTVGAGKQDLATSRWALAADAPTDADTYAFLDAIRRTLPGRLSLYQMSLQRLGPDNAVISDANIHVTASGEWLSNGASRELTEVK